MVYTLGESLLDIIFNPDGTIASSPGGAMLNVATSLGRMGIDVSLISETGDDEVGKRIDFFLGSNSVSVKYIKKYENIPTSLALAFLNEKKIPSYTFHKSYPDKRKLLIPDKLTENDIIVFGSIYSLDVKIRKYINDFLAKAKSENAIIIYDPNIRHSHHLKDDDKNRFLMENIAMASIIKGSDEDFENIFGTSAGEEVVSKIRTINPSASLIITRGEKGAEVFHKTQSVFSESIPTNAISTIGAGDNFSAGLVYFLQTLQINTTKLKDLGVSDWKRALQIANTFASRVCSLSQNFIDEGFVNEMKSEQV